MSTFIATKKAIFYRIARIILSFGALNYGSKGLFDFNMFSWITGNIPAINNIIYIIIAIAGIIAIVELFEESDLAKITSDS